MEQVNDQDMTHEIATEFDRLETVAPTWNLATRRDSVIDTFSMKWGMPKDEVVEAIDSYLVQKGRKRQKADVLVVETVGGAAYRLRPVRLDRMPSNLAEDWLRFQKGHVPGSTLDGATQNRIQLFMREHRTECLSDGKSYFTLAGGMLALCDPKPFMINSQAEMSQ